MDNAEAVLRAKCEAGNGDACLNMGFHILGLATINRCAHPRQRTRPAAHRPRSASRVPIDYKKRFLQFKVPPDRLASPRSPPPSLAQKNADEAKQEVEVLRQKSVEFFKRGCSLGNGEVRTRPPMPSAVHSAHPSCRRATLCGSTSSRSPRR